jgi:hypothetical protein
VGKSSRKKFLCLDCGVDTSRIGEFYYVNLELWLKTVGSKDGMLCIECLEQRIGRKLNKVDFTEAYINDMSFGIKSERLRSRLLSI